MMPPQEELEDKIVAALRRIVRAIDLRSRRLVDQLGFTGPQLMVLREARRLCNAPIGALARAVSVSQPTVSGIVDRLEKRGLVRRARSASDRRSVAVTITPEGGRVLRDAPSLLQDRFHSELERLEQFEQTQILATLQRIAWMMDAEDIDAAPMLETGALAASAIPESETEEIPPPAEDFNVKSS